jgi:hypothetical protein
MALSIFESLARGGIGAARRHKFLAPRLIDEGPCCSAVIAVQRGAMPCGLARCGWP